MFVQGDFTTFLTDGVSKGIIDATYEKIVFAFDGSFGRLREGRG